MSGINIDTKSVRQYNTMLDIIITLMIVVPLFIILLIVIAYINNRRVYQASVSQHRDFPEESDLTQLSAKLGGIDKKCKDNVRWVYSHKYLDPIYGLCKVDTIEDCYRWLVCMRPNICKLPDNIDKSQRDNMNCSKLQCKYLS